MGGCMIQKELQLMREASQYHQGPHPLSLDKSKALRYERFDSLKYEKIDGKRVTVETDERFMESIAEIIKLRGSVIDQIMGLKNSLLSDADCDEIHFKGRRHCLANILNLHSGMSKKNVVDEPALSSLFCRCGCQRLRGEHYPMTYQLEKISILGSGILLFFYMLKALAVALILFILIFAIFAVATNLLGTTANVYTSSLAACTSSYCEFRDNASDNYKTNQHELEVIQGWLGLAAMAIWVILSRVVKYVGRKKDEDMDTNLTSASDFAIKIGNLPYGEFNEEELLEYFQKLNEKQNEQRNLEAVLKINREASEMDVQPKNHLAEGHSGYGEENALKVLGQMVEMAADERSLGIKSIQIIYNMEFSRKMIDKITVLAMQVKNMTKKIDGKYVVEDRERYYSFKTDLIETYELFQDLRKKFLNDSKFRKALSTRVAIIEFVQQNDKTLFLHAYGKETMTFFKQLRAKLVDKCCGDSSTIVFKGSIPEITRAPEPSDIIWQNCEKKESLCRMLLIYFITFLLILLSLGIMVGLKYGQNVITPTVGSTNSTLNSTSNANVDANAQSVSTLVNIVVSLVMQVINAALWVSLSFLLQLEYNYTLTNKIVSQMTKTSVAMWINIIILPIIVNYFINNRYYGADGLAGIVYDYHISTIAVGLTVKLLDPMSLLIWLGLSIKCIRNNLIKTRYQKLSNSQKVEEQSMKKVYSLYEAPEFNIAEAYTYILSNILHASFFCDLQPFIILLALVEVIGFYWVCKFKVLRWCKIPQMTEKLIFDVAHSMFVLVPIFYGVGSIFNGYIASRLNTARSFTFIPAAISIGIGLVAYLNPKNSIQNLVEFIVVKCCQCCKKQPKDQLANVTGDSVIQKNVRLDTYYKFSNSLSLLGFENILLGKLNMGQISEELQTYCQSHVRTSIEKESSNYIQTKEKEPDKDTELKDFTPEMKIQF